MRRVGTALLATTILAASATLAKADVKVVTSIKPIHSLVSAVMSGVGAPSLLVEGSGSPHTYSLKPSQARQLQEADLVFWMSHDLEAFLEFDRRDRRQRDVSAAYGRPWVNQARFPRGGAFDAHAHDGHDDHDDHKDHDDHGLIMTIIKRTTMTTIMTTMGMMTMGMTTMGMTAMTIIKRMTMTRA